MSVQSFQRIRCALFVAVAPIALAACGDRSTTAAARLGTASMSIALRAERATAAPRVLQGAGLVSAAVGTTAAGQVIVGLSNDTLVIESVKVVLDNVRLRRANVATCVDSMKPATPEHDATDEGGCARLDLGAMVVNVPLASKDTAAISATIPVGSYRAAQFDVRRIRTGTQATARDSALLVANPEMAGASIRVAGRYRDSSFVFYSRASAEIELEFEPALVISASTPDNLTVTVHPSRWFLGQNGAILSPRIDANRFLINANIRAAFEGFEDHNRQGQGDDMNRSGKSGKSRETEADTTVARP